MHIDSNQKMQVCRPASFFVIPAHAESSCAVLSSVPHSGVPVLHIVRAAFHFLPYLPHIDTALVSAVLPNISCADNPAFPPPAPAVSAVSMCLPVAGSILSATASGFFRCLPPNETTSQGWGWGDGTKRNRMPAYKIMSPKTMSPQN